MSGRRREKPLTPQEAIEAARRELLPYWFGAEPMLAGVRTGGKAAAYPLDSRLAERPWLFAFLDLTSSSAPALLVYLREWTARYEPQRLSVLVVLATPYSFLAQPEWVGHWLTHAPHPFVVALDRDNLLAQAFQATELPRVMLLSQGKVVFQQGREKWASDTETQLQAFFRRTDPGLPLFRPLGPMAELRQELPSIELGTLDPAERACAVAGLAAPLLVGGQWTRQNDRWVTRDPQATLSFRAPGAGLGVVAQAEAEAVAGGGAPASAGFAAPTTPMTPMTPATAAQIQVDLTLEPGKDSIPGVDLALVAQGASALLVDAQDRCRGNVTVQEGRLYRVYDTLPPAKREVTLRFPNADKTAVALYAIRFTS